MRPTETAILHSRRRGSGHVPLGVDLSPPTLEDRGVGSPAIVKASSVHLLLYGGQIALGFDYAAGQHVAADMS